MKKVAFYTLGCKLNYSETSTISRMFKEKGYQKVAFTDNPDIFIINTCSVTENADKKCRKIVREARSISPDSYVAIIGCYAQLKPKEISEIEGVDAVLGAAEKFRLMDLIGTFVRPSKPHVFSSEISEANKFNPSFSLQDRTRTFLKIQDGCSYGCAFCTIPLARGKSRSDTIKNIIDSANKIAKSDVKEIVITGINTGDFGVIDGKRRERFVDLLKALDKVEGIDRFRISSIEPNLLTTEIIKFVAASERFVPHFHIPLQSGSNKILKRMNRRYLSEVYIERVTTIKDILPDACIGADVIVGFPGETEEDFLETYRFINELDISYLHVFSYSERPNTVASSLDGIVPIKDRHRRSKMLRILSEKKRHHFYTQQVGKVSTVLFENDIEYGKMRGFTNNYVRVSANYDPVMINELKEIRITNINEDGLAEVEEFDGVLAQIT